MHGIDLSAIYFKSVKRSILHFKGFDNKVGADDRTKKTAGGQAIPKQSSCQSSRSVLTAGFFNDQPGKWETDRCNGDNKK